MAKQQIEQVSIEALIPYARNSRTHSDAQVAQIAASIKEFGFTNPVLIDQDDGIIAGHGRTLAARKLGLKEVPCIRLPNLSEAQKRAYVIADNNLALNAGWDIDMLKVEIDSLNELNFDISVLGLGDDLMQILDKQEIDLGLTPEEKLDNYLNGDTKILRLAYSEEDLQSIVEMLDKGLEATGSEDYSSLIYGVIRKESAKW
jgi:ParB family transcriptional regulator, chromosome partitioning protein